MLSLITNDFIVVQSGFDETTGIEDPNERVRSLARGKAADVFLSHPKDLVIGADTVVYIRGETREKPRDMADAERMIRLLSGNVHTVHTGVCVLGGGNEKNGVCVTEVEFDTLSEAEISQYLKDGSVMDKAGAYGIQSAAGKFIKRVGGCFYNVMGLPVNMLYNILKGWEDTYNGSYTCVPFCDG